MHIVLSFWHGRSDNESKETDRVEQKLGKRKKIHQKSYDKTKK